MKKQKLLWIETFTGKKVNPLSARPKDIEIEDIAHSLAMQCRFNGHCKKFYSVAEHSVNTARYLFKRGGYVGTLAPLFALLHDAAEAYLCDIPRPLKPFIRNYVKWENELAALIFAKFAGRQPTDREWDLVMEADNTILSLEADKLASSRGRNWNLPRPESIKININCYSWAQAKKKFLKNFVEIKKKHKAYIR